MRCPYCLKFYEANAARSDEWTDGFCCRDHKVKWGNIVDSYDIRAVRSSRKIEDIRSEEEQQGAEK